MRGFSSSFLLLLALALFFHQGEALLTYNGTSYVNYDPLYSYFRYDVENVHMHAVRMLRNQSCTPIYNPHAIAPNISMIHMLDIFGLNCTLPLLWQRISEGGTAGLVIAPFPDHISVEPIYLRDGKRSEDKSGFWMTLVRTADVKHMVLEAKNKSSVIVSVSHGQNSVQAFYESPGFTAIHAIFGVIYLLLLIFLIYDFVCHFKEFKKFVWNFKVYLAIIGSMLCIIEMAHMFVMIVKRPGRYQELHAALVFFTGYFLFYCCYVLMIFAWLKAIMSSIHLHGKVKPKIIWIWIARVVSIITSLAVLAVWCTLAATIKYQFTLATPLRNVFYVAIAAWLLQSLVSLAIGGYLYSILRHSNLGVSQLDILKRVTVITVGCILGFIGTTVVVLVDNIMDEVTLLDFWYLATLQVLMLLMFASIIAGVHYNFKGKFSLMSDSKASKRKSSRVSKQDTDISMEKEKENKDPSPQAGDAGVDELDRFRDEARRVSQV